MNCLQAHEKFINVEKNLFTLSLYYTFKNTFSNMDMVSSLTIKNSTDPKRESYKKYLEILERKCSFSQMIIYGTPSLHLSIYIPSTQIVLKIYEIVHTIANI